MIDRDRLAALVGRDLSSRQIAAELGCSQARVQSALRRHGLRTTDIARRRRRRLERLDAECGVHGRVEHVIDGAGAQRCVACRTDAVTAQRRRTKLRLIEEAGGACVSCGFSAFAAALHFHHVDPTTKAFGIAHGGMSRSYEALAAEAAKCVLLCANCHAGVEAGVLPEPRLAEKLPGEDSNL